MSDVDAMYADLRRRGQITVGHYEKHLIPRLRYRAKRDGLTLTSYTPQPARRRGPFIRQQMAAKVALIDERGWVYAPDAKPRPCAHNNLVIEGSRTSCADCGRETNATVADLRGARDAE